MSVSRVVVAALLTALGASAQTPAPATFEVATIKLNPAGPGPINFPRLTKGVLFAENVTLSMMLQSAYNLSEIRISGPSWLNSDYFDMAGKAPAGVADADFRPLLQELLKERFHLEIHMEKREMPVYDLVIAKDGPKLQVYDSSRPFVQPQRRGRSSMFTALHTTTAGIATMLSDSTGRPVVDKTGLTAEYTMSLSYMPLNARPEDLKDPNNPPDIFGAVTEQLGLKLEPKKEPIDVLVVDHMDRMPTAN